MMTRLLSVVAVGYLVAACSDNVGGAELKGGGATGGAGSLPGGSAGDAASAGSTPGGTDATSGGNGGANVGGTGIANSAGAGSPSGGTAGTAGSGAAGAPNPNAVEQWHPIDIELGGSSSSQLTDTLSATFTGPNGQTLKVPGFFDEGGGWRLRFAPTATGDWSYTTAATVTAVNGKTGTIHCVPNTNPQVHGRVLVDAEHPHYFKYEDGTPYIMMGFEADWLGLMDFGDAGVPKAKALVDMYTSRGFNQVFLNVFAYDTGWRSGVSSADDFGPPAQYPWLGSNAAPNQKQMNPKFFAGYDRVIQYLFDHGVVAHLMIKVYNKDVKWPAKGSAEDDLYFNYVLARYQAYPNLVWDFAKESNNEPDVAYKSDRIKFIRDHDAYDHPVSTHTDVGYYGNAASTQLLDFRTDQNQNNWYDTIISHRNAHAWPIINSEFDYEVGNDGGKTYGQASDKLTVLKRACEVTMAGGYFAYYYTYHAWDVVRSTEVPGGLDYYKNLYGVLAATQWSELNPSDALIDSAGDGRHCLAKAGKEYLIYLAHAGSATLGIDKVAAGNTLRGKWVNLVSGKEQAIAAVGNGPVTLTNPWSDPALAHLAP